VAKLDSENIIIKFTRSIKAPINQTLNSAIKYMVILKIKYRSAISKKEIPKLLKKSEAVTYANLFSSNDA
jgi:hypothetical protein